MTPNPMTSNPTVGIIYPDHAAEDDYQIAGDWLQIHLPVAHIYGTDLHAVPELIDLGRADRLAEAAARLAAQHPEAVMWACTSASFVYGLGGARQQADQLATAAGVPAASTSQAFIAALETLQIKKVAIAASYPQEVATLFVDYLAGYDIETTAMVSAGIDTAAAVAELTPADVFDLAVPHNDPTADALLIPDTAMRTVQVLSELETRVGKPVLTANQVTIWYGLQLAGVVRTDARLGTLFTV